jgi:hypothetical protein
MLIRIFYHNSNSTDVGSSPNVLLKGIWFPDADMVAIAVQSDITIKKSLVKGNNIL